MDYQAGMSWGDPKDVYPWLRYLEGIANAVWLAKRPLNGGHVSQVNP